MSRIYDNQPLGNLPVINIEWQQIFDIQSFTKGNGVLFEGTIQNRSHFIVQDPSKQKVHFYIFHIKLLRAHRRKFDTSGQEIEPNFSEKTKVSTGYLNSSYHVEAKGKTDLLKDEEARQLIMNPQMSSHTQRFGGPDLISVWMEETRCRGLEFESGDSVRVKTQGDSPFVFSIAKLDGGSTKVSNYAGGEGVGASWTDKIMNVKDTMTTEENEGVEDDEWDD